jgi:hypothetical protein
MTRRVINDSKSDNRFPSRKGNCIPSVSDSVWSEAEHKETQGSIHKLSDKSDSIAEYPKIMKNNTNTETWTLTKRNNAKCKKWT